MHRTFYVLRLIGCWSLVLALALHVGLNSAAAQPQGAPEVPVLVMGVGTTQVFQMTTKEKLRTATNPNPKVLNLSKVALDPTAVLIEALVPGRVRVTLTDVNNKSEDVDVVVLSDRVKDLRDLIQRSVPNAAVTVSANESNSLVVLNGYVLTEPDAKVIRGAAINLFGPNVVDNIRIGGVQQVQLHVVVAVVNRSLARNMSFSWVANGNEWFFGSLFGTSAYNFTNNIATGVLNSIAPATGSNATFTGPFNMPFGVIHNNNNFLGFLQILAQENVTKIMAEPRVTTLSGRPAYVVSGGQTPILTSSGVGGPSVSYKQFGTVVSCLPTVLGNGKILLEVKPEISAINAANSVSVAGTTPTSVPGFDIRSAQVTVQIEDGQTLAIGGLIQNKINAQLVKVPVLGDIPYLSVFFQQKSYTENEEEMIILVTPRLVDPVDCTKIPQYLPGRETRSPDDFEFFLEGILEAPRGPRNVVFHPHLYQAAFKNAPNIGQFPCADGNCNGGAGGCAGGNCGVIATPTQPSTPYVSTGAPPVASQTVPAPIITTTPNTVTPVTRTTTKTVAMPTIPSVPATPSSTSGNRFTIEAEPPSLSSPVRETTQILPPLSAPLVPPVPPRDLQNRPALPPLATTPYSPN